MNATATTATTTTIAATDSMKMSPVQATTAHALARAYGHLWAYAVTPEEAAELTINEIAERAEALQHPVRQAGIFCPWAEIDPDDETDLIVRHTTGTGRLRWAVWYDGRVDFEICRPGGAVVVSGTVTSPTTDGERDVVINDHGAYRRHFRAAAECVSAVVGWKASRAAWVYPADSDHAKGRLGEFAKREDPLSEQIRQAAVWADSQTKYWPAATKADAVWIFASALAAGGEDMSHRPEEATALLREALGR